MHGSDRSIDDPTRGSRVFLVMSGVLMSCCDDNLSASWAGAEVGVPTTDSRMPIGLRLISKVKFSSSACPLSMVRQPGRYRREFGVAHLHTVL
jgi:hypothetical protein